MDTAQDTKKTTGVLNSLLRGELSATETYSQAIDKLRDEQIPALTENRTCHQDRLPVLRKRIVELGGNPDATSGMWGSFAKLVEGGAKLFGRDAAIAALEEGEDRGLSDYRDALGKVDPATRAIIEEDLLPAQERTHRRMSDVKHRGGPRGKSPSRPSGPTGALATMLAATAMLLPLLGLSGCGDDRHVAVTDVPEPARSAIVRHADSGQISDIDQDNDNGKVCYHVKVMKNGTSSKFDVDSAGNVSDR